MLRGRPLFYRKSLLIGIACVLVCGVVLLDHGFSQNPGASANPPVTWSPSLLTSTVSAGSSNTFNLSFLASEDLGNVTLRVVPELQPFVQVTPSVLKAVTSGQVVSVMVKAIIPATTLPQTLDGTIQLRATGGSRNTIAQPLPVSLNIVWSTYSNAQTGVQLSYPDFGVPTRVDVVPAPDATRLEVSFQTPGSSTFVSGFDLFLLPNADHLSLSDWFHQNIDPDGTLISTGAFLPSTLLNGAGVLVLTGPLPEDFGPIMSIYGISQSGNTILSLGQAQDNNLDLYGLSQEQIRQMLLEVLTNLKAP